MTSFFEEIKKERIKTPTQRGFTLKKWESCWDGIKNTATARDQKIYIAGKIIYQLLEEVRSELGVLYTEKRPKISDLELLISYVSLSNRDSVVLQKNFFELNDFSHSSMLSKNEFNNDLSFMEMSNSVVDARNKAIFVCKDRLNKSKATPEGSSPISNLDFIRKESYLSELYGVYEDYWQAILWNDYNLIEADLENKVFIVEQPMNTNEISYEASEIRKQRLGAESASISSSLDIQKYYDFDKYISILKVGRRLQLTCLTIGKANSDLKTINSTWRTSLFHIFDTFGEEFLKKPRGKGFSVYEVIEVFRVLVLLSPSLTGRYPDDDSFNNIKSLSAFCPKVKKNDLAKAVEKSTAINFNTVTKILDFIEYKGSKDQGLWCHPLISVSKGQYAFLTSALSSPVLLRVVEHWLVSLNISLESKGIVFENLVVGGLNKAIESNRFISDYDEAIGKRIKLKNGEEEIDLLLRLGDVILVGESKSIVTTDSPISHYRTLGTLQKAAVQVKRKTQFFQNNIPQVFENLDWKFDSNTDYQFVGCIINSGRVHVGFEVEGVPVTDDMILTKYFKENLIPQLSVPTDRGAYKHIAQVNLYGNSEELKNNLDVYLRNPPQMNTNKKFEYKEVKLPCLSEDSYKIIYRRLIPKDIKAKDILNFETPFEIIKSKDYEEQIDKIDIMF